MRLAWQAARAVRIPVIGIGGIASAEDALEFLIVGCRAFQVGTANFVDPGVHAKILAGLRDYLERHRLDDVNQLVGSLEYPGLPGRRGAVMTPRSRLIVALDVASPVDAGELVSALRGRVGMFKVGSQLFTAAGPDFVRKLVDSGEKVFLDLKYHDIPNTVADAVAMAARLGVSLVDVHALGGKAMLEAAVGALPAMATRLLAITVLTGHDEGTLGEIGVAGTLPASVRRLARLAQAAGLDGVVASPHEVALIREACGRDFLIVTPGIRPTGAAPGDQARTATPTAALAAGADYLVVGRPILRPPTRPPPLRPSWARWRASA